MMGDSSEKKKKVRLFLIDYGVDIAEVESTETLREIDTYRAYNVKDIKIASIAGIKVCKPSRTTDADGSAASISTVADLHRLVKQYDKDFHPLPSQIKGEHTAEELLGSLLDRPVDRSKGKGGR